MITELRRSYWRPATAVILLVAAGLPLLLLFALRTAGPTGGAPSLYVARVASSTGSGFVAACLVVMGQLALTTLISYLFGQSIAREAESGTLRVVLTTPVARSWLLARKALTAWGVTAGALLVFVVVAGLAGAVSYGTGDLAFLIGDRLPFMTAVGRFGLVVAFLLVAYLWVGALGMLSSVLSGRNPLTAVAATAVLALVVQVFGSQPYLGRVRDLLPTRDASAWTALLRPEIDITKLADAAFLSLGYTVILAGAAVLAFRRRDLRC